MTATAVATLGFEHCRSAHPGVRAKNLFQTIGHAGVGKSKQYLQTKIPEK
jgi:hypothetical protein